MCFHNQFLVQKVLLTLGFCLIKLTKYGEGSWFPNKSVNHISDRLIWFCNSLSHIFTAKMSVVNQLVFLYNTYIVYITLDIASQITPKQFQYMLSIALVNNLPVFLESAIICRLTEEAKNI